MRLQTLYEGRWIFAALFSLAIVSSFFSGWLLMIFAILLLCVIPQIATWLPDVIMGAR